MKAAKGQSIIDEIKAFSAAENVHTGPKCGVCRLPGEFLAAVNQALTAPGVTRESISRFLKAKGHKIAGGTLSRHFHNCPR